MKFLLVAVLVTAVVGDLYLLGPRGSNNRLNEQGRERNNANRLFDSQNNNRGGFNQGNLIYYAGSVVNIEWTNQHSCGNVNNNCDLVLQMMCGDKVRDGTTTNTIPDDREKCDKLDCNNDLEYGMHEDYWYYKNCDKRYRNKGLYTADQNMRDHARSTRQDSNGNRHGYECPEERDYYPYWHPTPWMDVAIFMQDMDRCDWYQSQSQNKLNKGYCKYPAHFHEYKEAQDVRYVIMNNKAECEAQKVEHGGELVSPVWAEEGSWDIPAPECVKAPWSRDNHHGNNKDGFANSYNWTVPEHTLHENCVLRFRYNISTGEYPPWDSSINASMNADQNGQPTKIDIASRYGLSPDNTRGYQFQADPDIDVFDAQETDGVDMRLALAMNMDQYGRTFEDRTHAFEIRARPANLKDSDKIHNLNVRGKRGNIVQTYPGVEYDFQPNRLEIEEGDYLHIQWTGANSNPQNNAGQGRAGTDRNNIMLLRECQYVKEGLSSYAEGVFGHSASNYPVSPITDETNFLGLPKEDLVNLAYPTNWGDIEELDDASTHYDLGLRKITKTGIWRYMCSRNNNFTNRSQKGEIRVVAKGELASK